MNINFSDLSPGVIGIIIWSLVSYFINKSKNKNNKEEAPFIDKNDSSQNTGFQFDSILDPQNSQSILNFDSNKVPLVQDEPVFDDFDKDVEIEHISVAQSENINEEEIEKEEVSNLQSNDTGLSISMRSRSGILTQLSSKKNLMNSFIIKEILDKPLSLRND